MVAASTSPATAGDTERQERGALHGPGRRRTRADEPHRADPVGVGAADAVGVVVGVVHADLQGEGDHEGEQRLPPDRLVVVRRDTSAGEHRRDRGRQRARARAGDPVSGGGHGRDSSSRALAFVAWVLRLSGVVERDIDAVEAWLEADDPGPAIVATSGSSGAPKQVVLSRDAVLASAAASAARLGGTGSWLLALPSSYVAGLNVVVRSLVAGHRPVVLGERSPCDAVVAGAYLSLVPTQLHRWLDSPDDRDAMARFAAVLVGGGPVDAALKDRARNAGIRLVATYGMAETCGGCVYDGLPLDGVGLALATDGRVRLSGPTLFDGYLDDPEATAEVLVDGWFHTSDAGRLDQHGRLQVLGRLDDVVISGGVNVPAARGGRAAARASAGAGCRGVGTGGRRVGPPGGGRGASGDLALDEARAWVGEQHPRSWAPREVVVVPALPMLANGKIDRLAVRELAGEAR